MQVKECEKLRVSFQHWKFETISALLEESSTTNKSFEKRVHVERYCTEASTILLSCGLNYQPHRSRIG
jgi:hypothetical protein